MHLMHVIWVLLLLLLHIHGVDVIGGVPLDTPFPLSGYGSKYLVVYLASKSFLCHLAASVAINVFGEESGTINCVNNHLTGRVVLRQHFQVKQALCNRRTDEFQTISKIDIDARFSII